MRDIDSLVLVRQDGSRKVIYDLKTAKYSVAYERPLDSGWHTNAWLLFQPFVIAGVEAGQRMIETLPHTVKQAASLALFFLAACIAVTTWEVYLSRGAKRLRKEMREIPQPDAEKLSIWARDHPRRLRNAILLGVVTGVILSGLLIAFFCTGRPILLTLGVPVFSVTYCIIAAGRPLALWKYYALICRRETGS